jgi:hypothetical protein
MAVDLICSNCRTTTPDGIGLLQLVASVVAGILWDRVGHVTVFYYGAAFALLGSIRLLLLVPRTIPGATQQRYSSGLELSAFRLLRCRLMRHRVDSIQAA